MSQYFCFGLIDFIFKGKYLFEYTHLFLPNQYKNNDKAISKYFE